MTERPKILKFRKEDSIGPTDAQWQAARTKAESNRAKFCGLVCEDDEGAMFVVPVNVESEVHLEAMVHQSQNCFLGDEPDEE